MTPVHPRRGREAPGTGRACEPSADEVPALEVLDQRLRSCEANEHGRIELAAHARGWGTVFDTPRGWGIDRGHRNLCLLESLDDGREWLSNFAREAEAYATWSEGIFATQDGCRAHEPKMASTMWSVDFRAAGKSSTKGTSRSSSCLASR